MNLKPSSLKVGARPGTLLYTGRHKDKVKLDLIDYDEKKLNESTIGVDDDLSVLSGKTVSWLNVSGLSDTKLIEEIGETLGIHTLVLEDVLSVGQRPKTEDMEGYIFLVTKMVTPGKKMDIEQVSFILGKDYVLSFQEKQGDVFDNIRTRLRAAKGRIRKAGSDYLMYALLDTIVDRYYPVLENIGDRIEKLENNLLDDPKSGTLKDIHGMKRELILLRKAIWPMREVVNGLIRSENKLISKSTAVYLKDVYDHTIQVIETIDSYRDIVSGMLDTYLSSVSNGMNEVMKVLTIIATIFIPLTFLAGIYGMNFDSMPELSWQYGYAMFWVVILIAGLFMYRYFRKKGWL